MSRCSSSWRAAPAGWSDASPPRSIAPISSAMPTIPAISAAWWPRTIRRSSPPCSPPPRTGSASKGMKRATGPFSLSVNEEVGLLVWGFDSRPVLMVPYDPPYAGARVEGCGYAKIKDLFSYDYDVQNAPGDDRRQADGAGRHGRPGQGAHRQHEDVRRRGPNPGRHLQRRLERQLGLRALHPGRDRPCLQGVRAGDRARARGVRGGRRRGGGLHRGADQPQRGGRGLQRPPGADQPRQAPVAAQDRRRRQHAGAADGGEEEVPQPSADGRRARHDGDRPAPRRTASGWARPAPSWAGSSRTTRRPTTSSARSAGCTTRPIASTRRRWGERAAAAWRRAAGARPSLPSPTAPS